ncbi:hypothetical protein Q6304_28805, partial [Klebsiella pneumoniae]|nr:hypothetical protein [Klebsiella pneumoniae]
MPPVKGYYLFQNVVLPKGTILKGESELPYVANDIKDIIGNGSAVSNFDSKCPIFKFNNHVSLKGLALYGNKNIDGLI